VSDEGIDLPQGEVGEVWFEGSSSFEYYKDAKKTAAARRQGRATFGDLGYLDESGVLYLTDRKAFTINVGGVNVYPREAEDVLTMHPSVSDVAVFGVPHPEYGEEVKGVVELISGIVATAEVEAELLKFCRSRLAKVKSPRSIDFEASLPRHPNGKLYKRKLRDRYLKENR
jgi:acyl-CoA synthetase (AMP-forming)/AMP-acid ligase II